MGFFSWNTADTKESIANAYSGRECKPVYLLQPNGQKPILEEYYNGYGDFGGVDAFEWLATQNVPAEIIKKYEGECRGLGIEIFYGFYIAKHNDTSYAYIEDKVLVSYFYPNIDIQCIDKEDKIEIDGVNSTIQDHCRKHRMEWEELTFPYAFPLKFSFDKNAIYEQLPSSDTCEFQGYFYDDEN